MARQQEPWPIVVMGAPRSGTTFLTALLNAHPDVFLTPEARLFEWAHRALNVVTAGEERLLNAAGDIRPGARRPPYRTAWVEHLRRAFPDVIRDFYQTVAPQARYWGDKNPHYAEHGGVLATIADLFPDARFIHIVRDGRDVATSLIRTGWVDWTAAHDVWIRHVDGGRVFGQQRPPGRYLELRYEDLIGDDNGSLIRLFSFLGVDTHPEVVAFFTAQRHDPTPFSRPTRDLNEGATSSEWRQWMSAEQQLSSLQLIGDRLIRHEYETATSLAEAQRELADRVGVTPLR